MTRDEILMECRASQNVGGEITYACATAIVRLFSGTDASPAIDRYLIAGMVPSDNTDSRGQVTTSGETMLWRTLFEHYGTMPADDKLMGDMLGTYFTRRTNTRLATDEAWREAYRIAFIGASNPLAAAGALARCSKALMNALESTQAVCEHHALQAIAGHVAFLYKQGIGADIPLLDEIEANAKRLGIWVS